MQEASPPFLLSHSGQWQQNRGLAPTAYNDSKGEEEKPPAWHIQALTKQGALHPQLHQWVGDLQLLSFTKAPIFFCYIGNQNYLLQAVTEEVTIAKQTKIELIIHLSPLAMIAILNVEAAIMQMPDIGKAKQAVWTLYSFRRHSSFN